MFDQAVFIQQMQKMRVDGPLVHCMTNDVVVNFTANVLLAVGASPAMIVTVEESGQFACIASSLLVNVGTLTSMQAQAMKAAVVAAYENKIPWVLDPVAFGVLAFRTDFCLDLLQYQPTVIRANASEIAAIGGNINAGKGADSTIGSDQALDAAKYVALKYKTIVALTGKTDYVTDGHIVYALNNGHEQLTKVTGTGCSLSAMVAAYCAISSSPVLASLTALSHMAIAGEVAKEQTRGVGHFAVSLLDQLQLLAQSLEEGKLQCQKI